MRSLVISVAAFLMVLIPWYVFMNTAGSDLQGMIETVKTRIVEDVAREDWAQAEEVLEEVAGTWYRNRREFSVFLDAASIDDIESSFAKAIAYVRVEEKGAALAEIAYLHHQLLFLLENELTKLENIL